MNQNALSGIRNHNNMINGIYTTSYFRLKYEEETKISKKLFNALSSVGELSFPKGVSIQSAEAIVKLRTEALNSYLYRGW